MNNFTFGNAALPVLRDDLGRQRRRRRARRAGRDVGGFDGTSVVQTHMTNSRLTDPEVLEFRFPVRLESYEIRTGLGRRRALARRRRRRAARALPGADDRQHPVQRPRYGRLRHGRRRARAVGINRVVRADGTVEELAHIGQAEMKPGDVFEIHTPGGGGYGPPR